MELFLKAIILGIVEGITEFLPISSTGHLILINQFIDFTGNFAKMFDVVIQLGAILAVVVYFWNKLFTFSTTQIQTWKKIIVGVIPAIIIGGTLGNKVEQYLFNPITVSLALFIGGVILILVERRKKTATITSIENLKYKTVLAIGFIQCLAIIPGTSRSAATIIGAMLLGTSRSVAAEFSFFLAIPTMAAASAYSLLKHGTTVTSNEWIALSIGFIISFIVALLVIKLLMNYIRKHNFAIFGYYRIMLAIIILIYLLKWTTSS